MNTEYPKETRERWTIWLYHSLRERGFSEKLEHQSFIERERVLRKIGTPIFHCKREDSRKHWNTDPLVQENSHNLLVERGFSRSSCWERVLKIFLLREGSRDLLKIAKLTENYSVQKNSLIHDTPCYKQTLISSLIKTKLKIHKN